ncbi:DUF5794 domain-containing protein [Halorientalis litorea]|jgi:hypothetical protein|uniref:DUF5794 domain-containing protein n=1 Tax=Halorientalis litorea TaxID=2931977 RepID=UPI001FF586B0|nr:DUF5794 domain-containing protein [Halorientalis litorea]
MSQSQHPVALRIEQRVGGSTRLLATVMCLPLLDGIFPALVLAGALSSPTGIVEVGLLIFGGSATVAVILAEMDGTVREQVKVVLAVGAVVVTGAVAEAALAPTIQGLVNLAVFERFAALVILAVAAQTASARIGDVLPRPAVIVSLGLVASLDLTGAEFVVRADPDLMLRAGAAALVAVVFALHLAVFGPWLREIVDIDRFRFGSAVALGVLPLGLFGLVPGNAPLALAVLGVSFLFAFDPEESWLAQRVDDADLGRSSRTDGGDAGTDGEEDDPDLEIVGPPSEDDRAPWL